MGLGWVKRLLLAAAAVSAAHSHAEFDSGCVEAYREWSSSFLASSAADWPAGSTFRAREDANQVWRLYQDIELRRYDSARVDNVLKYVKAKPENEMRVLTEFVRQIESGAACRNDKPAKSWIEILESLKPFAD